MSHAQRLSRLVCFRYHLSPCAPIFLGIILGFLWLFPASALAGEATLAWDPPSTEYGGFILAYGTSSGTYTNTKDVGTQASYTVTGLNPGQTYYFAVKTYNTTRDSESTFSNQVIATLPSMDITAPASPKNVQVY